MAATGAVSSSGVPPAAPPADLPACRTSVSATTVAVAASVPDEEEQAGAGCLGTCCPRINVASLRRPVEVENLSYDTMAFFFCFFFYLVVGRSPFG
jgi:hypothetical protein